MSFTININTEKDITKQLDQYMDVVDVKIDKENRVKGTELLPYVLIIDTEKIYRYDGKIVDEVFELDKIGDFSDIDKLKKKLYDWLV